MCLYFKVFPFSIWYFEQYLWDKTTLSKPFKLNTYPVMHNYVKNSVQFCKKRSAPYDSVVSLEPPLAPMTCNNHFRCHFITLNVPLFFAALLQFTELIKHLYTALLSSHRSIWVWTLRPCSTSILFFFFSHSVPLSLWSFTCCMSQFRSRLSCRPHVWL